MISTAGSRQTPAWHSPCTPGRAPRQQDPGGRGGEPGVQSPLSAAMPAFAIFMRVRDRCTRPREPLACRLAAPLWYWPALLDVAVGHWEVIYGGGGDDHTLLRIAPAELARVTGAAWITL